MCQRRRRTKSSSVLKHNAISWQWFVIAAYSLGVAEALDVYCCGQAWLLRESTACIGHAAFWQQSCQRICLHVEAVPVTCQQWPQTTLYFCQEEAIQLATKRFPVKYGFHPKKNKKQKRLTLGSPKSEKKGVSISIYLSIYVSMYLCIYLSIYLSVCLSFSIYV